MSAVFFANELEAVATFWRIYRRDGVCLGFTSHNRDLYFDCILHRAAPGMIPSAIRLNGTLHADAADIQGALAHDSICAEDLENGLYDGARIEAGAVDWESLKAAPIYSGKLGSIISEDGTFSAELISSKQSLERDYIPRTSPTCRAQFCGQSCGLAPMRFTSETIITGINIAANTVSINHANPALFSGGSLRWVDGPQAGISMQIIDVNQGTLTLDTDLNEDVSAGMHVLLREGCDHTLATCNARFGNAINFQGEPFLPGNDLLSRYPTA